MDDYALVLNAGSSSLKFCVFQRPSGSKWRLEARGQIEGIGTSGRLSVKGEKGERLADQDAPARDGAEAVEVLAGWLRSNYGGSRVVGVGHRVVHGGPNFAHPTIINDQVLDELRALTPLAPLHQPYNLTAIEAVAKRLPDVRQVACFDTSFHRGQPAVAELVPLPKEFRDQRIQRYGFHGLSYEYIASVLPEVAPEIAAGRVIVAHLGSGASMCAMKNGKSIDSTLGFTALDGLCMGTRPGALDPGVVLHLFQGLKLSAKEVEALLYKKSGLLGISGISNDMRDLLGRSEPEARLAMDYFVYRAAKEIGALASVLRGVDGIVFTAGIGENSPEIRQRICEASAWLGIELDPAANTAKASRISTPKSKVSVWVIPTNEELMIARHTASLLDFAKPEQQAEKRRKIMATSATLEPPPKLKDNEGWKGFQPGIWQKDINVRDFIQQNYQPYEGDASFLASATERTKKIWGKLSDLFVEERKKSVLDISQIPSSINAHGPGYIDRENEVIVGLQTEAPLKRAIMPNGGFRMVLGALKTYGYTPDPHVVETFTKYRKTHNNGVFDAYTADIRRCRSSHILTGLPDAYGRGRIIGDYRRVALYGVARLIEKKQQEKAGLDAAMSTDEIIRDREELSEQIRSLEELQEMAMSYGFDVSVPAKTAREAVQWLYFGYLAAVKEQNGAAMSLGRTSTFLDIYFQRDLDAGTINEQQAQEIIDDFVIKLRIVRFLRTPEYDELFAGDPTWVTESIGGMGDDGRPLTTKSSFRFLQTLYTLGPAPEPNLTIWYSPRLPEGFRNFSAKVAIDTSSIQFESDEIMRSAWGDDGAIACCVSPMLVGKQMQFFGARANVAKCLLYAINGGRDEVTGEQIGPALGAVEGDVLDFDDVLERFEKMMDWLAGVYVNAMNVIHYMHDKYAYERLEMALHDYSPMRTMAFGMAGMSVVADSLSAMRHAKVKVVRDKTGLITDYKTEGTYPFFGNNDNRVDHLAAWVVSTFMTKLRKYPTYRKALHTQSILTITSNVVYGKSTGNTPDGRRKGEPFAPGANPMHGRDTHGIHASAASVAKIPYRDAADGISLTASLLPQGLGRVEIDRITNLRNMLDTFFGVTGYHMNVNVLNRETLMDAMEHPEKYPSLTIRVSGYAVNFVRLTREQQMDVINRTFHGT